MSLNSLMIHTADVKYVSYSRDESGHKVPAYTAKYDSVPCNVQPAQSNIITAYKQRDEDVSLSMFYVDQSKDITTSDRVFWSDHYYMVVGRADLCGKQKVFRLDLRQEQT